MASVFWDSQGAIMAACLEKGRAVNGAYSAEELRRLRQEMVKKRRGKLTRGVLLLQDSAPVHTQVAIAAATKCRFEVLRCPPYSPDLILSDLCLFPNLTLVVGSWEPVKAS